MNHTCKVTTALAAFALTAAAVTVNIVGGNASAGGAIRAAAEIRNADGIPIGWAKLTEDAAGRVHVNIKVSGLSLGLHGTHIHAVGNCDPTNGFAAASSHFNPGAQSHGPHAKHDHTDHHAGDLPNLAVNASAQGTLNTTTAHVTLAAGATKTLFDADGSAIIIHIDPDNFTTQPTGGSGGRIACGVIERD